MSEKVKESSKESSKEFSKKPTCLPHQRSNYNMFTDKSLKSAFKSLPKEDQERYKQQGENMYSVDYEGLGKDPNQALLESAAYISEGLKSGLLPTQLTQDELNVMRTIFGETWFEKFGYESEK